MRGVLSPSIGRPMGGSGSPAPTTTRPAGVCDGVPTPGIAGAGEGGGTIAEFGLTAPGGIVEPGPVVGRSEGNSGAAAGDAVVAPLPRIAGGGTVFPAPFERMAGGGTVVPDPLVRKAGGGTVISDPLGRAAGGGTVAPEPLGSTAAGGRVVPDPVDRMGGGWDGNPAAIRCGDAPEAAGAGLDISGR